MTKFDDFETALRKLCEQHRVALAPTDSGEVGVWDLTAGDAPIAGLVDCTVPTPDAAMRSTLPMMFATGIEASQHPGYVGQELSERLAKNVQQLHPGSVVVPIGSSMRTRAWAVIKPA